MQVVVELILQERPWDQVLDALKHHFPESRTLKPLDPEAVSAMLDRPNSLGVMQPSCPWVLATPPPPNFSVFNILNRQNKIGSFWMHGKIFALL